MGDLLGSLNGKILEIVIAAVMIILIAVGRIVVTREQRTVRRAEEDEEVKADLSPVLTRLDALDRAQAQRFESLAREQERVLADTEKEMRRQFDRLHDRWNVTKGDR